MLFTWHGAAYVLTEVRYCGYNNGMIRVPMRQLGGEETDSILKKKCAWILRVCASAGVTPVAIIAYGSAARNELREDSDLDLAIIFRDAEALRAGRSAVCSAKREDLWPPDLLFYTQGTFHSRANTGGVCMIIRDEGIVLYGSLGSPVDKVKHRS